MRPAIPAAVIAGLWSATACASDPVDFGRDIRPILAKRCYACHGPEMRKSGLRLDGISFMRQGGDRGPAVVPGSMAASPLVQAIAGDGSEVPPMPPKGERLTPGEVALVRAWVERGAAGTSAEEPSVPARGVRSLGVPTRGAPGRPTSARHGLGPKPD